MASQTSRSGRPWRAPVRLADEQAEEAEAARRRRTGEGERGRAQPVGPDEGVDLELDAVDAEAADIQVEDGDEAEVDDNDEGYDSFIEDRSRPATPPPNPAAVRDADGWKLVAKLGPTACFLSSFPALQEVPDQHEQAWVDAFAKVMRKWREAATEVDITTVLSWLLFLPQALLRRPTRGGLAGRKEVARRFNYLARGDWGSVLEMWEKDKSTQTADRERRRRRGELRVEREDDEHKRRREVVALIAAGQISKAMTRVTSHGLANMEDAQVMAQVAAKYPPRGRPLPARVPKGQPVEHLRCLRDRLKALQPGSAPGCGGMRPEYLRVLGNY